MTEELNLRRGRQTVPRLFFGKPFHGEVAESEHLREFEELAGTEP